VKTETKTAKAGNQRRFRISQYGSKPIVEDSWYSIDDSLKVFSTGECNW
jgi:hypothetical protein